MKSHVFALGVFLLTCSVAAEEETLDVQAFLPLFERNSIERKVLDVSYSLTFEHNFFDKMKSGKRDIHLVFDTDTLKYREERKHYTNPNDTDSYDFKVEVWDGKEAVSLHRPVSPNLGSRVLGRGVYEYPGHVVIQESGNIVPLFAKFYYASYFCPFVKTVHKNSPRLGSLAGNTITIETEFNKFEFSKKTGALERLVYYSITPDQKKVDWETYRFSDHMEVSGVWMPLRIARTLTQPNGSVLLKEEISVDPKTLRLLDKVEDPSIFTETLPAGCAVNDQIRKKIYTVTTADTLPNDVEALRKALEKMAEQALEQKEEAEKEMREKK